jgi:hypothetical protein
MLPTIRLLNLDHTNIRSMNWLNANTTRYISVTRTKIKQAKSIKSLVDTPNAKMKDHSYINPVNRNKFLINLQIGPVIVYDN